jgi:hypothetical protein
MAIAMTRTSSTNLAKARRPRRALPLSLRVPIDLATAIALTCLSALASMAAEADAAAEIVAAQIRTQGYACSSPVAAERDRAASRPNETVWMLNCGNARYRVRLVPNMAAQVTQLE